MTQHVRPGAGLAGPQLTRRGFLGLSAGVVGGLAVPGSPALAAGTGGGVVPWIDRHAVPLSGPDPQQPAGELSHLRGVVRGAAIVGLGESAHGTHTQLRLKHRVARYLVENLGFRTIAWEEGWGSGVAIDRHVTTGHGDPTAIVGDALFLLRTDAMLELVGWMREFNRGRPDHDKVRFLGADVLELRPVQFDEIRGYVAEVAPDRREELPATTQRAVIAHARAVYDLVRTIPTSPSAVNRDDAVQHAHALLGFYHSLVDHVLGQANDPDYLIDLHHHGPPPVRGCLQGAAKMRIIGSAYHPANDADYAITVDPWSGAFDAILHLNDVTPSRLLAAAPGPPQVNSV